MQERKRHLGRLSVGAENVNLTPSINDRQAQLTAVFTRLNEREQELVISIVAIMTGLRMVSWGTEVNQRAMSLEQLHAYVASMKADGRFEEAERLLCDWIAASKPTDSRMRALSAAGRRRHKSATSQH
jgi:hypothetical protein